MAHAVFAVLCSDRPCWHGRASHRCRTHPAPPALAARHPCARWHGTPLGPLQPPRRLLLRMRMPAGGQSQQTTYLRLHHGHARCSKSANGLAPLTPSLPPIAHIPSTSLRAPQAIRPSARERTSLTASQPRIRFEGGRCSPAAQPLRYGHVSPLSSTTCAVLPQTTTLGRYYWFPHLAL